MEQQMTTRPSMRRRDMVAHLGGGVVAVKAARVERDCYLIATAGAAARGWEPPNSATIHDPITINRSQLTSADLAAGGYRLLLHNQNRLFLLRPLKGAAAADLPVVLAPWDQIELVRVLPNYTSCH
jgi:hypothetical protein